MRGTCHNALFIETQDAFEIAIGGRLPIPPAEGYDQYAIGKIELPHRRLMHILVQEPTIGADFEHMVFAVQGTTADDKSIQVYLLRFRENSIFPTLE